MAITLTQIRAFLAVRSAGSVHAAAGQLLVSQPSVSAALASLARELGTVLFERHGRHPGQLVGRSPYLQPVQATAADNLIGRIVRVTVTEVASNSLFGTVTQQTMPEVSPERVLLGA